MRGIREETTNSSCEKKRYEFIQEKRNSSGIEFEQNSSKTKLQKTKNKSAKLHIKMSSKL